MDAVHLGDLQLVAAVLEVVLEVGGLLACQDHDLGLLQVLGLLRVLGLLLVLLDVVLGLLLCSVEGLFEGAPQLLLLVLLLLLLPLGLHLLILDRQLVALRVHPDPQLRVPRLPYWRPAVREAEPTPRCLHPFLPAALRESGHRPRVCSVRHGSSRETTPPKAPLYSGVRLSPLCKTGEYSGVKPASKKTSE